MSYLTDAVSRAMARAGTGRRVLAGLALAVGLLAIPALASAAPAGSTGQSQSAVEVVAVSPSSALGPLTLPTAVPRATLALAGGAILVLGAAERVGR